MDAPDADLLLRHRDFLRGLARGLLRDEHAAEDVVQEAIVVGLTRPPADRSNLRAWLGKVTRNLSLTRRRGEFRRLARERAAGDAGTAPSSVELAGRLEIQRRVIDAVDSLETAYRDVIVLRYFDGLSFEEMAPRTGQKSGTLRTRHRRAVEMLRDRLDSSHGGNRTLWSSALLPLLRPSRAAGATLAGGILMSTKSTVAVLILAALAALALIPLLRGERFDSARQASREPAQPDALAVADSAESVSEHQAESEPDPAGPVWRVVGDVQAPDGSRVDVLLHLGDQKKRVATGQVTNHAFALELPQIDSLAAVQKLTARVIVKVFAGGFLPAVTEAIGIRDREPGDLRFKLTLVPGGTVMGRVLDSSGQPVEDAGVWLSPDATDTDEWTDADGFYAIAVKDPSATSVCASHESKGTGAILSLDLSVNRAVTAPDIMLGGPGVLSGIVVYPNGRPAAGMQIRAKSADTTKEEWMRGRRFDPRKDPNAALGLTRGSVKTGVDGRFRFEGLRVGRYTLPTEGSGRVHETGVDVRIVTTHRRIRVHIRDENGDPIHGFGATAKGTSKTSRTRVAGDVLGHDAVMDITAKPGETWVISSSGKDTEPAEVKVVIREDKYEYDVELVLRLAGARGRIRLRLIDPDGKDLKQLRASLYTLLAGDPVLYEERLPDGITPPVPVGRFKLVVHPGVDMFALYMRHEEEVTVRADSETAVTIAVQRAGRVRFHIVDEAVAANAKLRRFRAFAQPRDGSKRFSLHGPLWRNDKGGYTLGGRWPINKPTLASRLLEPGNYDIEIEVEGRKRAPISIVVSPGEIVDLRVPIAK